MSLFRPRARRHATIDGPIIPPRGGGPARSAVPVTNETAMRHSAVWACLRLRANLISTFPLDTFRRVTGINVEVPRPPVLVDPGGELWDYSDWMYASQVDLDRAGNAIGLVTERNALGLPARIDLQPIGVCSVIQRAGEPEPRYRIDGKEYDRSQVWHERQYVVAGLPVGLSPIAYAAWTIGEYLSLQQFASDWFGGGGVPKARLRNTAKTIDPQEAEKVKTRYRDTVSTGDLFVHGKDWEFDLISSQQAGMEWLEGRRYGLSEVARFFDVPADLIDAAISAPGTLTYASITQRNLQFLIMSLEPAIVRREKALSKLMPRPRFAKLNTDALLRMDPETRTRVLAAKIAARILTPTEARQKDNLPPLTPEQEAEFARLFGAPRSEQQAVERALMAPWEQVSPLSAVPAYGS